MPANRLSILAKYRDQKRLSEARGLAIPETRTADECRRSIDCSTSATVLDRFTCYATTTKGLNA